MAEKDEFEEEGLENINDDDIDFGNIDNLLDEDSNDDLEVNTPKIKKRKPVTDFSVGVLDGFKPSKKTFDIISDSIASSFPQTSKNLDATIDTISQISLYKDQLLKDIQPTLNRFKIASRRLLPKVEKLIPSKLYAKLEEKLTPHEGYKAKSVEEQNAEFISGELSSIFGQQAEVDKEKAEIDKEKYVRDQLDKTIDRRLSFDYQNRSITIFSQIRNLIKSNQLFFQTSFKGYLMKDLELKFKQLFISKDLLSLTKSIVSILDTKLEGIIHNTGLPDVVKKRASEEYIHGLKMSLIGNVGKSISDITSNARGIILKNIKENVFDRVKEGINNLLEAASDAAEMQYEMDEMEKEFGGTPKSTSRKVGGFFGGLLQRFLIKTGIGGLRGALGEKGNTFEDKMRHLNETAYYKLNELASEDTWYGQLLKNIITPIAPERGEVTNTLAANATEEVPFDVLTRRSIIEIIPGYLAKILQQVEYGTKIAEKTSNFSSETLRGLKPEELVFDKDLEDFITVSEYRKRKHVKLFESKEKRTEDISKIIEKLYAGYSLNERASEEEFEQALPDIISFINNLAKHAKVVEPKLIVDYLKGKKIPEEKESYLNYVLKDIPEENRELLGNVLAKSFFKNYEEASEKTKLEERGRVRRDIDFLTMALGKEQDKILKELEEFNVFGGKRYMPELLSARTEEEIRKKEEELIKKYKKSKEELTKEQKEEIEKELEAFSKERKLSHDYIRKQLTDVDEDKILLNAIKESIKNQAAIEKEENAEPITIKGVVDYSKKRIKEKTPSWIKRLVGVKKEEEAEDKTADEERDEEAASFNKPLTETEISEAAKNIEEITGEEPAVHDELNVSGPGVYIQGVEKELHLPLDQGSEFWKKASESFQYALDTSNLSKAINDIKDKNTEFINKFQIGTKDLFNITDSSKTLTFVSPDETIIATTSKEDKTKTKNFVKLVNDKISKTIDDAKEVVEIKSPLAKFTTFAKSTIKKIGGTKETKAEAELPELVKAETESTETEPAKAKTESAKPSKIKSFLAKTRDFVKSAKEKADTEIDKIVKDAKEATEFVEAGSTPKTALAKARAIGKLAKEKANDRINEIISKAKESIEIEPKLPEFDESIESEPELAKAKSIKVKSTEAKPIKPAEAKSAKPIKVKSKLTGYAANISDKLDKAISDAKKLASFIGIKTESTESVKAEPAKLTETAKSEAEPIKAESKLTDINARIDKMISDAERIAKSIGIEIDLSEDEPIETEAKSAESAKTKIEIAKPSKIKRFLTKTRDLIKNTKEKADTEVSKIVKSAKEATEFVEAESAPKTVLAKAKAIGKLAKEEANYKINEIINKARESIEIEPELPEFDESVEAEPEIKSTKAESIETKSVKPSKAKSFLAKSRAFAKATKEKANAKIEEIMSGAKEATEFVEAESTPKTVLAKSKALAEAAKEKTGNKISEIIGKAKQFRKPKIIMSEPVEVENAFEIPAETESSPTRFIKAKSALASTSSFIKNIGTKTKGLLSKKEEPEKVEIDIESPKEISRPISDFIKFTKEKIGRTKIILSSANAKFGKHEEENLPVIREEHEQLPVEYKKSPIAKRPEYSTIRENFEGDRYLGVMSESLEYQKKIDSTLMDISNTQQASLAFSMDANTKLLELLSSGLNINTSRIDSFLGEFVSTTGKIASSLIKTTGNITGKFYSGLFKTLGITTSGSLKLVNTLISKTSLSPILKGIGKIFGFYKGVASSAKTNIERAIGLIKKLNVFNRFSIREQPKYVDVYLKNMVEPGKPLITARQQVDGEVVFADGSPIKDSYSINKPVIDVRTKETVITENHLRNGLVDINNKPLTKKLSLEKVSKLALKGIGKVTKGIYKVDKYILTNAAKLGYNITKEILSHTFDILGGTLDRMSPNLRKVPILKNIIAKYDKYREKKKYIEGIKSSPHKIKDAKFINKDAVTNNSLYALVTRKLEIISDILEDIAYSMGINTTPFVKLKKSRIDKKKKDTDKIYTKEKRKELKEERKQKKQSKLKNKKKVESENKLISKALPAFINAKEEEPETEKTHTSLKDKLKEKANKYKEIFKNRFKKPTISAKKPSILKRGWGYLKDLTTGGIDLYAAKNLFNLARGGAAAAEVGTTAAEVGTVATEAGVAATEAGVAAAGAEAAGTGILAGAAGVIFAPITLTVLGTLAAGTAVYYGYKYYKKSKIVSNLRKMRMKLYNASSVDEDLIEELENRVNQVHDKGKLTMDEIISYAEKFGFNTKDEKQLKYFAEWLTKLFTPVFLTYTQYIKSTNNINFSDEDSLSGDDASNIAKNFPKIVKNITSKYRYLIPTKDGYLKATKRSKIDNKIKSKGNVNIERTPGKKVVAKITPKGRKEKETTAPIPRRAILTRSFYDKEITNNKVIPLVREPGELGSLSAKYESGHKGNEAIGYDKIGGTSYGKYQLSSKSGTFNEFLEWAQKQGPEAKKIADELLKAGNPNTGSKEGNVPRVWKKIAKEKPKLLNKLVHNFIKETHYDKALNNIKNNEIKQFINNSKTLQNVLWSTAVQHGPYTASKIFENAYKKGIDIKQYIKNIYDERLKYFKSSPRSIKRSILNRYKDEASMALSSANSIKDKIITNADDLIKKSAESYKPIEPHAIESNETSKLSINKNIENVKTIAKMPNSVITADLPDINKNIVSNKIKSANIVANANENNIPNLLKMQLNVLNSIERHLSNINNNVTEIGSNTNTDQIKNVISDLKQHIIKIFNTPEPKEVPKVQKVNNKRNIDDIYEQGFNIDVSKKAINI